MTTVNLAELERRRTVVERRVAQLPPGECARAQAADERLISVSSLGKDWKIERRERSEPMASAGGVAFSSASRQAPESKRATARPRVWRLGRSASPSLRFGICRAECRFTFVSQADESAKGHAHFGPPGATGLHTVQQSTVGLQGEPLGIQVAASAALGATMEVTTGTAIAAATPKRRTICRRDNTANCAGMVAGCASR